MLKLTPGAMVIEDVRAGEPAGLASTVKLTDPGPATWAVDCKCTKLASAAGCDGCQVQGADVCTWNVKDPPEFGKLVLGGNSVYWQAIIAASSAM